MQDILIFFKAYWDTVTIIISMLAAFGINLKSNKELKKSIDSGQDAEITSLKSTIAEIKEEIAFISSKFKLMLSYIDRDGFNSKLKSSIDGTIQTIFKVHNGNIKQSRSLTGLIYEGGEQAYYFFKNIRVEGYENLNTEILKEKAITILRGLRSHAIGAQNINYIITTEIKEKVAYPAITTLLIDLMASNPECNKLDDEQLLIIATKFIRTVVNGSIAIYLAEPNKCKL